MRALGPRYHSLLPRGERAPGAGPRLVSGPERQPLDAQLDRVAPAPGVAAQEADHVDALPGEARRVGPQIEAEAGHRAAAHRELDLEVPLEVARVADARAHHEHAG